MDCNVAMSQRFITSYGRRSIDLSTANIIKLTIFCAERSTLSVRLPLESRTRSVFAATRGQTELRRFHGEEAGVWLGMPPVPTPSLSPTCRPPAVSQDQLLLEQS